MIFKILSPPSSKLAVMPPRHQSSDHSSRRGDDWPVLPPIRDWFRDEWSSLAPNMLNSSTSYQPSESIPHSSNRIRGMHEPSYLLPLSNQTLPHLSSYKVHPAFHSYPDLSRSFTPTSHVRSSSEDQCIARHEYSLNTQHALHAGMQTHHREHCLRQTADNSLFSSAQEALPNAVPRAERHDGPQSGRASSLSRYKCNYCGKGFNRPSSLKTHLNTHTGEKPFICPHDGCGRAFSVQSNMRRHARVHTQLNPRTNSDSSSEDGEGSLFEGLTASDI